MKIVSSAFGNNEMIPKKYTCDGKNISPPLLFSDVPMGAKSLVLIVDDPDAPMGIFTHWVIYNIPANTYEIKENSVPTEAKQGMTDFGEAKYGGPCPPSGTHRYFFKLYALDINMNFPDGLSKEGVRKIMESRVIDQGELVGLYKRGGD